MVNAARNTWFAALIGLGCALPPSESPRPTASRDLLSGDEIRGTTATDAWEAITLLRPEFLRWHGAPNLGSAPVIYIDGIRTRDPQDARSVRTPAIMDIVFLNERDATTRFGTGHTGGAVLISTKRRPTAG